MSIRKIYGVQRDGTDGDGRDDYDTTTAYRNVLGVLGSTVGTGLCVLRPARRQGAYLGARRERAGPDVPPYLGKEGRGYLRSYDAEALRGEIGG